MSHATAVPVTLADSTPWGPAGEVVYNRTYSRTKPDGSKETWPETVRRVAEGNLRLVYGEGFWPQEVLHEYERLVYYMSNFAFLPAGRHLWATGVPGRQYLFSCHVAGWGERLSDHFSFSFLRLMEGGGVGANYSMKHIGKYGAPTQPLDVHIICDPAHADMAELHPHLSARFIPESCPDLEIADSREGWAGALVDLINQAFWGSAFNPARTVIYDVSKVRPSGSPLKTFGGTASGPAPLARMLLSVAEVLNRACENQVLTPLDAMEIDHAIAECVVSGGNRRSARMSIVRWDDPYIMEFLKCKEIPGLHWTTNISVEVDDEFLECLSREKQISDTRETYDKIHQAHGVHAAVVKGMLTNGEPGYWNSSLSQAGEVGELEATNPCVTADTWVTTTDGPRQVAELISTPHTTILGGKPFATDERGFYQTGHKDVYRVRFQEGFSIRCTGNQEFYRPDDSRVEVQNLNPGEPVQLSDQYGATWVGSGLYGDGYLLGSLIGDGTFYPDGMAAVAVWDNSGDAPVAEYVEAEVRRLGHRSDFTGWHRTGIGTQRRIKTAGLTRLASNFGVIRGSKTVTDDIEKASPDFYRGFLRGLFDTDGHVEGNKQAGYSARLTQSDEVMLRRVQRMLMRLGIKSSVRASHPEGRQSFEDYSSKASYRLIVSGRVFLERFMHEVGFLNEAKQEKLETALDSYSRAPYEPRLTVRFESMTHEGTEDVYDCTVPGPYDYEGNGLRVRDCGEIPLEAWENCNLGHVNMDWFAGRPKSELVEAHRLATRFLMRATYGDVNDEGQRVRLTLNRRIGVGHLGVQGYWAKQGVEYSQIPDYAASELIQLYSVVRQEARDYAFRLRIPEPVKVTTVAPTGSVAKLPGVSEGIHPIYARHFERRIRFSKRDEAQFATVMQAMADGFTVEDDVYDQSGMTAVVVYPTQDILVSQVMALGYDDSVVQSADELSVTDMLSVQRVYQKYWADNAVSYTVNIPEGSMSEEELASVLASFLPDLKGTTVMVDASRPQSPYTRITQAQFERATAVMIEDGTSEECRQGSCPVR